MLEKAISSRFPVRLATVGILIATLAFYIYRKVDLDNAKRILVAQSKLIHLGASMNQAEELLSIDDRLTLRKWGAVNNGNSDVVRWRVSTPDELGAKNWVLIVLFEKESVVGIGLRTADSDHEKPEGTPKDRFARSIEELWRSEMSISEVHRVDQ